MGANVLDDVERRCCGLGSCEEGQEGRHLLVSVDRQRIAVDRRMVLLRDRAWQVGVSQQSLIQIRGGTYLVQIDQDTEGLVEVISVAWAKRAVIDEEGYVVEWVGRAYTFS
jgi:hypothetical protein